MRFSTAPESINEDRTWEFSGRRSLARNSGQSKTEEALKEDGLTSGFSPTDELRLLLNNLRCNSQTDQSTGRNLSCVADPIPQGTDLCGPPAWVPRCWTRVLHRLRLGSTPGHGFIGRGAENRVVSVGGLSLSGESGCDGQCVLRG